MYTVNINTEFKKDSTLIKKKSNIYTIPVMKKTKFIFWLSESNANILYNTINKNISLFTQHPFEYKLWRKSSNKF